MLPVRMEQKLMVLFLIGFHTEMDMFHIEARVTDPVLQNH
jgi:hypothetical protein